MYAIIAFQKKRHFKRYNRPLHQNPWKRSNLLKQRELRLNENNREFIYHTKKKHESVIPSNVVKDKKCTVVIDNLVYTSGM